ncbi:MAG: Gfo/Idh/MocA family oxidoreductase [Trueperaceae bacterium]
MNPPLRVAVVGAGVMGRHHANVYRLLPDVELVGLVEPDARRRQEAEQQFGCPVYPDTESLLAFTRVDAASLAAPTTVHHTITERLLVAGVHVLVEKPVATRVDDAQRLAAMSRARGLVLQVGHITRFFRAIERLRAEVGQPYLIEARRLTPNGRIQDVGVVLDLMIHDIDIVLGLVRQPVVDVAVAAHTVGAGPHEDVCAAQVRFADGCVARFLASRVAPDAERSLVVADAQRTFRLDFAKDPHTEMTVYRPAPTEATDRHAAGADTALEEDLAAGAGGMASHILVDRHVVFEDNPLKKQLAHFITRIRGGTDPIGTLEDDIRSLSLAQDLLVRLDRQGSPQASHVAAPTR